MLSLLSAGLATPAAMAGTPAREGTVKYEVRYKWGALNTKVADATISIERGSWEGKAALHSRAVIAATSVFRLFMNAEYQADTYLSPSDYAPMYFINPVKKGGQEGKFAYTYDRAQALIHSETVLPPAEPELTTFPLDGRTMDLLSLLHYIRFHGPAEGKSVSIHLLMGGKSVPATLSGQGADNERFPDLPAQRFLLKMNGRGLMENGSGDEILVWRSAASDRRLLGLEAALSAGKMTVGIKE